MKTLKKILTKLDNLFTKFANFICSPKMTAFFYIMLFLFLLFIHIIKKMSGPDIFE